MIVYITLGKREQGWWELLYCEYSKWDKEGRAGQMPIKRIKIKDRIT